MTITDTPAPPTVVRQAPPDIGATSGAPPAAGHSLAGPIARVLITIAVILGWVVVYVLGLSRFDEAHAQKSLYADLRTDLAQGIAPVKEPVASGTPIALLTIPAAGVHNLVVVEGTSATDLQDGPGHRRDTVLPGQQGTSEVLGRALSFGAPFGRLHQLRAGDRITVTTQQGVFAYRVRDLRSGGAAAPTGPAPGSARLILVTAAGSGSFGGLRASSALYVDADLSVRAQPDAGKAPALSSADEEPMASDTSAATVAELALALQLVIAAFIATAWAASRWQIAAAWIAGAPVVLASLWLATDLASRLLPNLM